MFCRLNYIYPIVASSHICASYSSILRNRTVNITQRLFIAPHTNASLFLSSLSIFSNVGNSVTIEHSKAKFYLIH